MSFPVYSPDVFEMYLPDKKEYLEVLHWLQTLNISVSSAFFQSHYKYVVIYVHNEKIELGGNITRRYLPVTREYLTFEELVNSIQRSVTNPKNYITTLTRRV